jgi:hypothetical protein
MRAFKAVESTRSVKTRQSRLDRGPSSLKALPGLAPQRSLLRAGPWSAPTRRQPSGEPCLHGFDTVLGLYKGRLLAHQRKKAEAREVAARLRQRIADAGIEGVPRAVQELEAEIEG